MSTPVSRRMTELPGTEALRPPETAARGQLVYVRAEVPVLRQAEVITDPDGAGHYRRDLRGWPHGPHGPHATPVRGRPQTVAGFRPAHAGATR
ncbi:MULTISPECIES: hypothetical protein [unclassified Streptomyces]|uniref:hypothetical protein n=1 Tax=unclassified Streptomyces TaxID=2593676 RepID=UPI00379B9A6B